MFEIWWAQGEVKKWLFWLSFFPTKSHMFVTLAWSHYTELAQTLRGFWKASTKSGNVSSNFRPTDRVLEIWWGKVRLKQAKKVKITFFVMLVSLDQIQYTESDQTLRGFWKVSTKGGNVSCGFGPTHRVWRYGRLKLCWNRPDGVKMAFLHYVCDASLEPIHRIGPNPSGVSESKY